MNDFSQIYWIGVYISAFLSGAHSLVVILSSPLVHISQYNRNLKKIGHRLSFMTNSPIPRERLENRFWGFTGFIAALVLETAISAVLSWIGILYCLYKVLFSARGIWVRWTCPRDLKEALWRLKNQDLGRDDVIVLFGIIKQFNAEQMAISKKEILELVDYLENPVVTWDEGLRGYKDGDGNWVIKPRFKEGFGFLFGLGYAKEGEKWGVIDKEGNWVITPIFDSIKYEHETIFAKLSAYTGESESMVLSISDGRIENLLEVTEKVELVTKEKERAQKNKVGLKASDLDLLKGIEENDLIGIETAISKGANVNCTYEDGRSPLQCAAFYGNVGVIEMLAAKGGDLHFQSYEGNSVIGNAVMTNNMEAVRFLVSSRVRIDVVDENGANLFLDAIVANSVEMIRYLVSIGVDVNHKGKNGNTPLLVAAQSRKTELVEEFLRLGADPNLTNGQGVPPYLISTLAGDDFSSLVLMNRAEGFKHRDPNGATALHWAAFNGLLGSIKFLLRNGCDVNSADSFGTTPLHAALGSAQLRSAELLIAAGADTTLKNREGMTPYEFKGGGKKAAVEKENIRLWFQLPEKLTLGHSDRLGEGLMTAEEDPSRMNALLKEIVKECQSDISVVMAGLVDIRKMRADMANETKKRYGNIDETDASEPEIKKSA